MILKLIRGNALRPINRLLSATYATKIESIPVLNVDFLDGQDKGIVTLSFNRAQGKNSFNKELVNSLENALDVLRFSKETRAAILKSSVPGVFCAGADLKERLTLSEVEVQAFVSRLRALMVKVETLPVPVLAAIDGVALGGGLEIALATDIRVASENSKLGLVETRLAIIPGAGGTQRLPRIVGPALAKELIFTARVFSGKQARDYGIVNHCVPDNHEQNSAFLKTLEIAREIAQNGPVGVRMAKLAINKGTEVDISSGCSIEELCYAQVIPTKDRLEGLQAFNEKRKPQYQGH